MDSFWLEVENIKQSVEAEQEECSLADVKTQEGRLPKMLGVRGGRLTFWRENLLIYLNDLEVCWNTARMLLVKSEVYIYFYIGWCIIPCRRGGLSWIQLLNQS